MDARCGACHLGHSFDHPDPCLGWIEGARFACCGHGDRDSDAWCAYVAADVSEGQNPYPVLWAWLDGLRSEGLIEPGDFVKMFAGRNCDDVELVSFYLKRPGEEDHQWAGDPDPGVILSVGCDSDRMRAPVRD